MSRDGVGEAEKEMMMTMRWKKVEVGEEAQGKDYLHAYKQEHAGSRNASQYVEVGRRVQTYTSQTVCLQEWPVYIASMTSSVCLHHARPSTKARVTIGPGSFICPTAAE